MPDDKRNQQKGKSDAKEQRKPRQGRQKSGPAAKITPAEKKSEELKAAPQKPVYEDPGPEFYKNLKRETDEILKITEEANSKYKKKEIQSNWSKYEMPIESYEDIEEQENMGADYEKLVQMPLSVGGHFQFKHEKSWDVSTGPSPYDKYFEINMNNLANAICTIPFYDRNNIDKDIFSESDMLTMNNRAIKYKQKYYNDKSYTTPELEARDKIVNNFKEALSNPDIDSKNKDDDINEKDTANESPADLPVQQQNSNEIEFQLENKILADLNSDVEKDGRPQISTDTRQTVAEVIDDIDDLILEEKKDNSTPAKVNDTRSHAVEMQIPSKTEKREISSMEKLGKGDKKDAKSELKTPVIESPEDLEKWLDDFLDG